VVESIRNEIETARGTRIWIDYVNSLKLISQVVFTRSSGFILELLQNAEDAGIGLEGEGEFAIDINDRRVRITHTGKAFDDLDVRSICGVHSSKKPERGTLGYLGIGFKSVFKVSDAPEIYSGPFRFRFDRNRWPSPGETPWHVLPLWIDEPSELIDSSKTTFVIPFREPSIRAGIASELAGLTSSLYLFLNWIRRISVHDDVSVGTWSLESSSAPDGEFTVLRTNGREERFRFFRRVVEIGSAPADVRQDRLTQEYRANVTQREIAIAFMVDASGRLAPEASHAMYGGVYSFLPLGEARSGARFPIQADFLVQPGRDAINYQAPWNLWLMDKVAELCKEAITTFRSHPTWRYQYLRAFQFSKSPGLEAYDQLFAPHLIEPLEQFLQSTDSVPLVEGKWGRISDSFVIDEGEQAQKSLFEMGVVTPSSVGLALGGKSELKLVDNRLQEAASVGIQQLSRADLLGNTEYLDQRAKGDDAVLWFRTFYLWLARNPRWTPGRRRGDMIPVGYWNSPFILTSESELELGGNVWLLDFDIKDASITKLVSEMRQSKKMLRGELLNEIADSKERDALRGFLTGSCGVQTFDADSVCKEAVLPRIRSNSPKPSERDLLNYTRYCKQILGAAVPSEETWVLTKGAGGIRPSSEVIFSSAFQAGHNWETNQRYVPGLHFLSEKYIGDPSDGAELAAWRNFFRRVGVRDSPDNGVEEFGQNFAIESLRAQLKAVPGVITVDLTPVDPLNYGYDVYGRSTPGGEVHVEIKGQSSDADIVLSPNETSSADRYQREYYVCVVSGIPEAPIARFVRNPSAPGIGLKDKLTIPIKTWRERGTKTIDISRS
jgi:hypothetical protein